MDYSKYKKYKLKYKKYLKGGMSVRPIDFLEKGSTGEVYKHKDDPYKVVKKDISGEGRIDNEIANYITLDAYQGELFPKIYLEKSDSKTLVLDKLEINIYDKLKLESIEDNKILLEEIIKKIDFLNNDLGYCHNDLKFQNMGMKDDNVLFFDLEDMSPNRLGTCIKDQIFKSLMILLLEYLKEDNLDEYEKLLYKILLLGSEIYDDENRNLLIKKEKVVEVPKEKSMTMAEPIALLEEKEKEKKKNNPPPPEVLSSSESSISSTDSHEEEDDETESTQIGFL